MILSSTRESFVKRLITSSFVLWALVSCSNVVPPAPATSATGEALTTVIPSKTLPVRPSSVLTLEALDSPVPDPVDILDPQGNPAQEWRGVPIMPEATAGQEFAVNNAYSFKVQASAQDVQAFYGERLKPLGWSQPFDSSFDEDGGTMTFRKERSSLTITVTSSEDSAVVLLVMAFA